MNTISPFQAELQKRIRAKIKELRALGTVAMSVNNLLQVVRPPSAGLEGAPGGPASYRHLFFDVVLRTPAFNRFTKI